MGWLVVIAVAFSVELVLEVGHTPTLTASVRSLPAALRAVVAVIGIALVAHLVLPQRFHRHDPIDRLEHRLHERLERSAARDTDDRSR